MGSAYHRPISIWSEERPGREALARSPRQEQQALPGKQDLLV